MPSDTTWPLCLDTYVIRDPNCIGYCCQGPNLPDKVDIAIESGWTGVELWHKDVLKFMHAGGSLAGLRATMDRHAIRVPSYKVLEHTFTDPNFPQVLADHCRVFEIAQQLGAESVVVKVVHDNYKGAKPGMDEMCRRYERLLAAAEKFDIRPSLEFMSLSPFYNNLVAVCAIIKRVDNPRAALVLDTFHLWRNGDKDFHSFADAMRKGEMRPEWVSVVHFTDTAKDVPQNKQSDANRKMPGEGLLNLGRFLNLVAGVGYRGDLSLNVYDKSLWHKDALHVATDGLYRMHRLLAPADLSRADEAVRCDALWSRDYFSHLDPRYAASNRPYELAKIVGPVLRGKKVLDFKCGLSPLAPHVSVGFDASGICIDHLKRKHPEATWVQATDKQFAETYHDKIDVLMHLGLGDSDTEVASAIAVRKNCKPDYVILECEGRADGTVAHAKTAARWESLKAGLEGESYVIPTDMPRGGVRLLFVGRPA